MTTFDADAIGGLQRQVLDRPLHSVLTGLLARAARLTDADGAWLEGMPGHLRLTHGAMEPALETLAAPVLTLHADVGVLTVARTRPDPFSPDAVEWLFLMAEVIASAVLASEAATRDELASVRAETLARMHDGKNQLQALFDTTPLGVALVRGNDFALLRTNDALSTLTGVAERSLQSMTLLDLAPVAEREALRTWLRGLDRGTNSSAREMRLLKADGEPFWTRLFGAVVADAVPEQIAVQVEDITLQWQAQQVLNRLANNDPLTGLANRHQVVRQLDSALSRPGDAEVCLLYLDLDGFKAVNDTFGHSAGDELLVNVAERLAASVRPRDVVARLGGDEFVVVLDHVVDLAELEVMTKRIRDVVNEDVELATGERVHVTASIGMSSAQPGDSPAALIKRADERMYLEKRQHRLRDPEG